MLHPIDSRHLQPFALRIVLLAAWLVLAACGLPYASTSPAPPAALTVTTAAASPIPAVSYPVTQVTLTPTATPTLRAVEPLLPTPISAIAAPGCSANPLVEQALTQTDETTWLKWVRQLSGAEPVKIQGKTITLTTRFTPQMFASPAAPNAFDFVRDTVLGWYPAEQVQVQAFSDLSRGERLVKGKNLILTLPGAAAPDEVVILSAHLDSVSQDAPALLAPGAEDNASGSAALLEAARLFRGRRFARTLQIIWFTGEEQGLLGSKAFVNSLPDPSAVQGVINLDMFGYDSDGDRCFELHVGTLAQSQPVAECITQSIDAYAIDLPRYDILTTDATGSSDHGSFWDAGIGAVEILENMFDNNLSDGCPNADVSPYYHTTGDTADRLNPTSAIQIVRAAIAAAAGMAGPLE